MAGETAEGDAEKSEKDSRSESIQSGVASWASRLASGIFWFWPSILLALIVFLTFWVPGGPESLVVFGLVALQLLLLGGRVVYKVVRWIVAEANARSAQT